MDNYYTPEIEDFHIGFEYEWLDADNNWKKESTPIEISKEGFDEQTYGLRVKYLDKEDIESLNLPSYIQINNILNKTYEIIGTNGRIFRGSIKNKSELKKLLKQLNIDETR